jgi:hypothetical protein
VHPTGDAQMPFAFEKFVDTDRSFLARVSIRQNGQIGFNSGAVNLYELGKYKFVVMYYDRISHVIGILPTIEKVEGAIELASGTSNTFIRARNFLEKYSISYSEPRRFVLRIEHESGILYFETEKPVVNRAGKVEKKSL